MFARLPMCLPTSNVGNAHCVGRLATRQLLNKQALNGARGRGGRASVLRQVEVMSTALYAITNCLGNWGDVTADTASEHILHVLWVL